MDQQAVKEKRKKLVDNNKKKTDSVCGGPQGSSRLRGAPKNSSITSQMEMIKESCRIQKERNTMPTIL
eukprot:g31392.t1